MNLQLFIFSCGLCFHGNLIGLWSLTSLTQACQVTWGRSSEPSEACRARRTKLVQLLSSGSLTIHLFVTTVFLDKQIPTIDDDDDDDELSDAWWWRRHGSGPVEPQCGGDGVELDELVWTAVWNDVRSPCCCCYRHRAWESFSDERSYDWLNTRYEVWM